MEHVVGGVVDMATGGRVDMTTRGWGGWMGWGKVIAAGEMEI